MSKRQIKSRPAGLITHTPAEPPTVQTDEDELRELAHELNRVSDGLMREAKRQKRPWWRFRRHHPVDMVEYYANEVERLTHRIMIVPCGSTTFVNVAKDVLYVHCAEPRRHGGWHTATVQVHSADVKVNWPVLHDDDDD